MVNFGSHALTLSCISLVKYIGLLAMGKLLDTHPKLVAEHRDLIMECIDDADLSIRLRALDIVVGMVCFQEIS